MKIAALLLAPCLAAAASGLAAQEVDLGEGYLCCNLRSDGSWISDSNYEASGKTLIPFGTKVRHAGFGRYRVHVDIDGKRLDIGNDYSRDLTMEAFARRYIVDKDPRRKVAGAPPKIRQAIESARVTKGMTREQVLIALGYPIGSENPHLDAAAWKYWLSTRAPFTVHFDRNGRVTNVHAEPDVFSKVFMP